MRSYFSVRTILRLNAVRPAASVYAFPRRAMASNASRTSPASKPQEAATPVEPQAGTKPPLPLPEPSQNGDTINLSVGGEGVKLDHIGPLVVNVDGTMSRISNWTEMSEIEKQNTLRILGKRNQQRLKKLREDKAAGSGSGTGESQ